MRTMNLQKDLDMSDTDAEDLCSLLADVVTDTELSEKDSEVEPES